MKLSLSNHYIWFVAIIANPFLGFYSVIAKYNNTGLVMNWFTFGRHNHSPYSIIVNFILLTQLFFFFLHEFQPLPFRNVLTLRTFPSLFLCKWILVYVDKYLCPDFLRRLRVFVFCGMWRFLVFCGLWRLFVITFCEPDQFSIFVYFLLKTRHRKHLHASHTGYSNRGRGLSIMTVFINSCDFLAISQPGKYYAFRRLNQRGDYGPSFVR